MRFEGAAKSLIYMTPFDFWPATNKGSWVRILPAAPTITRQINGLDASVAKPLLFRARLCASRTKLSWVQEAAALRGEVVCRRCANARLFTKQSLLRALYAVMTVDGSAPLARWESVSVARCAKAGDA
jgi:hypothetical protein